MPFRSVSYIIGKREKTLQFAPERAATGRERFLMMLMLCILIAYFLGSFSPAALLSKRKQTDLREQGTGNLGTTNTLLVMGKGYAALVLLVDMSKALVAVFLAKLLCPELPLAGLLAGCAAVLGHIFPVFMGFRGGKGLASFAGMVLALDPLLFLLLLVIVVAAMLITNHGIAMPITAAVLFPGLYGMRSGSLCAGLVSAGISVLLIVKNWAGLGKAARGEDVKVWDYIKGRQKD